MRLFIPRPINVNEKVAFSQTNEMIGHRSNEFKDLMKYCSESLQKILFTNNRVLISTSSGFGLMEGAIRNCVNEDVLVCVCGTFGKKWASLSKSCGKKVGVLEVNAGKAIQKKELEEALNKKNYEAVCITLNETSTGIENNL